MGSMLWVWDSFRRGSLEAEIDAAAVAAAAAAAAAAEAATAALNAEEAWDSYLLVIDQQPIDERDTNEIDCSVVDQLHSGADANGWGSGVAQPAQLSGADGDIKSGLDVFAATCSGQGPWQGAKADSDASVETAETAEAAPVVAESNGAGPRTIQFDLSLAAPWKGPHIA